MRAVMEGRKSVRFFGRPLHPSSDGAFKLASPQRQDDDLCTILSLSLNAVLHAVVSAKTSALVLLPTIEEELLTIRQLSVARRILGVVIGDTSWYSVKIQRLTLFKGAR